MAIALATLETNLYTTVRNHLITGDYSLIPTTISNAAQVTPVYSDSISAKYGFPVVEIANPIADSISSNRFGNVQKADITIPMMLVEDNASDSKTSMDVLKAKFFTGKSVFKAVGLHKKRGAEFIETVSDNLVNKNGKNFHLRRFNVNFEYRERLDPPS